MVAHCHADNELRYSDLQGDVNAHGDVLFGLAAYHLVGQHALPKICHYETNCDGLQNADECITRVMVC